MCTVNKCVLYRIAACSVMIRDDQQQQSVNDSRAQAFVRLGSFMLIATGEARPQGSERECKTEHHEIIITLSNVSE
jgi:hypothetical protein